MDRPVPWSTQPSQHGVVVHGRQSSAPVAEDVRVNACAQQMPAGGRGDAGKGRDGRTASGRGDWWTRGSGGRGKWRKGRDNLKLNTTQSAHPKGYIVLDSMDNDDDDS